MNNEVLNQREAEKVIAVLKKQGISTRVTKVAKDLFVVKAETVLPEQKADGREEQVEKLEEAKSIPVGPVAASPIPDQETVLPEEKAAEDEIMEEQMAEDELMEESEARLMQADLRRSGIMASVRKVGNKFAIMVRSEDTEKLAQLPEAEVDLSSSVEQAILQLEKRFKAQQKPEIIDQAISILKEMLATRPVMVSLIKEHLKLK